MSSALDMSLDDIIKSSKKSRSGGAGAARGRGRGRGRGGATGLGPTRGIQKHGVNHPAPYAAAGPAAKAVGWQHMVVDQTVAVQPGRASSLETGTKLYISNLDYGVSNDDIKQLFSEVGDLKKYSIHYDRSGRSKGTAEVVYSRRSDAVAALKRYNNVQLDGKPMKIEIVGLNVAAPAPFLSSIPRGNTNGAPRGGRGRGGPFGRIRGGVVGRGRGRGSGGSGRGGRGRGRGEKVSAEDLDADLEKYHQESVQIN